MIEHENVAFKQWLTKTVEKSRNSDTEWLKRLKNLSPHSGKGKPICLLSVLLTYSCRLIGAAGRFDFPHWRSIKVPLSSSVLTYKCDLVENTNMTTEQIPFTRENDDIQTKSVENRRMQTLGSDYCHNLCYSHSYHQEVSQLCSCCYGALRLTWCKTVLLVWRRLLSE